MTKEKKQVAIMINSMSCGGAERVVSYLVSFLDKEGYNVSLLCLEKNEPFYNLPQSINIIYLTDSFKESGWVQKSFSWILATYRLYKFIKKNNIKTVQSHMYRANFINVMSKLCGARHTTQLVSTNIVLTKHIIARIKNKIVGFLYKRSDLLVFKSFGMKEDFFKHFPHITAKSKIIFNPCNLENVFRKKEKPPENFCFQANTKYIICVGRLSCAKRQKDLIKAFAKISCQYNNVEVILLGDGPKKQDLMMQAEQLDIKEKIHFLGFVKNPFPFLNRANVFVNCAAHEGLPNVLIEALACGIPIVASDCLSGPREILNEEKTYDGLTHDHIRYGKYGILYDVGNIDQLQQAIEDCLFQGYDQQYRDCGHERVKAFSAEHIIPQYKKVLYDE
jgi:glycosyltransferase involved in cell wall biosynthesis